MRIVAISDSHQRESSVFEIVERHKDNADLFVFLGDGQSDIDTVLLVYPDIKIERVAGNCDWGSEYPTKKIISFDGKRILITHGHPFYVKHGYSVIEQESKNLGVDICMFGHTHTPYVAQKDGIYYINPGSARDGSYAIIDIVPSGIMAFNAEI